MHEFWGVATDVLIRKSPESMISQWHEDIVRFTSLIPFKHFGSSRMERSIYNTIMQGQSPWRTVIITTPETFRSWYSSRNAGQQQFWGPGLVERVVIDEAHRLRTSGLGTGCFTNPASGGVIKIEEETYAEQLALMLHSLEPRYKWALTATPLVESFNDCVSEVPRTCVSDLTTW